MGDGSLVGSLRDCLCMPPFENTSRLPKMRKPRQLAMLVWPPVVLGNASWWSEHAIHREFNVLFWREEPSDRIPCCD